jgi:predicted DNA-binding protein (MmcQ/YjbR family)
MRRRRATGGILRPPSSSTSRRVLDPLGWIRRLCMALPGTAEVEAWGHPNFQVSGRTFAVFEIYKGRPCIAISADPEEQAFLVERFGFFKTPYVGNRGWVSAWVDQPAPFRLMGDVTRQAHRRCGEGPRRARKVTTRRRSPPAHSRPRSPRAV